jgi:hypothetical protein
MGTALFLQASHELRAARRIFVHNSGASGGETGARSRIDMRQNLSYSAIAATLAALASVGTAACGSSKPAESPVAAQEVPAATSSESEEAEEAAGAAESAAAGEEASAEAASESSEPTAEEPPAQPVATPPPAPVKKTGGGAKKTGGAKASCGAGTCG